MEKDELPSANEQMGMYRQQTRPRDDDVSLEAINDYVKERFMAPSQGYAEVGDDQATEVGQQGLQPTPQDPKLWLVECKTGSEREAVVSLMQKCVDLHAKRTPLAIKAVFTQDHLKVLYALTTRRAFLSQPRSTPALPSHQDRDSNSDGHMACVPHA